MGWQFFAVIQVFLSSTDSLLQRSIAKVHGVSSHTKAALSHVGIFLTGVAWATFSGDISFEFDSIALIYAAVAAFLIALGAISIFTAAESLDAANLNIIYMLRAVGVMVIAGFALNETLSIYQIIGAVLIIIAGYVASHPDRGEKKLKPKGVVFALIGTALFSVGLVFEKASIDEMGLNTYLLIGWGLQLLFLMLLSAKWIYKDKNKKIIRLMPKMLAFGFLAGLGGLTYLAAITLSDNTPLVVSFINIKVILVIIGGYIFLKERKGMHHKIAGGILALAGVTLLVL